MGRKRFIRDADALLYKLVSEVVGTLGGSFLTGGVHSTTRDLPHTTLT